MFSVSFVVDRRGEREASAGRGGLLALGQDDGPAPRDSGCLRARRDVEPIQVEGARGRQIADRHFDRLTGARRWSESWTDAVEIMQSSPQLTVHWNPYLRKYLAVTSRNFAIKIDLWTADRPEGPRSFRQEIGPGVEPPDRCLQQRGPPDGDRVPLRAPPPRSRSGGL